jgi:hypothetical protein
MGSLRTGLGRIGCPYAKLRQGLVLIDVRQNEEVVFEAWVI